MVSPTPRCPRRLFRPRRLPATLLPAAALLALSALGLGSCKVVTGILSWSMFPSFLSGVEATRDLDLELRDLLPEGSTEFGCRLAVLGSPDYYGGADFVFLMVGAPLGNRLIVLDTDLEIVNTVDDGNFGERFMVDAGGEFLVGWERFYGPDDPVPDTVGWGDTYRPGVAIGTDNCLVSAGDSTLYVEVYASDWSGPASRSYSISSAGGWWNVAGVGCDTARIGQELMLGLYAWDSRTLTVVFVDDGTFAGGTLAEPLQETFVSLGQGFTLPLEAVRRVHYTRKGVVVRTEEDDDRCYLFDFSGEELHRFQLGMRGGVEEAYDPEGEHFYYFSRDERILFKGRTGW